LVFGVDGSVQIIESSTKPHKALGFVKTAMITLDRPALATLDKHEPHPFAVRDILQKSQLYHATVFPLRNVRMAGKTTYDAIRRIIFDSLRDPTLEGQVFETLKWLAYELWDGQPRDLPLFECPNCHETKATLPYNTDQGQCPACNGDIFLTDMLGFHQAMGEDSAPDSVATDYMAVQETGSRSLVRGGIFSSSSYISQICVLCSNSPMKRAALYMRVSTLDQHPETQLYDLRQMAQQRGYRIVEEFTDRISGAKARRPGLDAMMRDARRGRFDVVLVWASDRIARSVKHFLDVLDELNRLNVEFISFREQIDTGGPLGRAVVVIIGAIAELERNLIVERVRAGMRRAKLEGRHIGRKPLVLDRAAILQDRQRGHSLSQLAKSHLVSRATVHRVLKEHASTTLEKSP
jgi:DNA invertase Pin-like site-specific DNA recombinase